KREFANPGRRSRHHSVQSPFAGSHRQLRAASLRALLAAAPDPLPLGAVLAALEAPEPDADRVAAALRELAAEGFLMETTDGYRLA
ncbi:MAG: adenine glycosylase, partial [Thermoleophilia bacterium]|nr:adenine glycosylase [Thermoleophilia bacterium]